MPHVLARDCAGALNCACNRNQDCKWLAISKREIEVGSGKEAEGDASLVKLRCEVSLMSTILIIPDKGEANSIIIASLLFHERMSVSFNKDTSVSVC